jgi:hypothetical protein
LSRMKICLYIKADFITSGDLALTKSMFMRKREEDSQYCVAPLQVKRT